MARDHGPTAGRVRALLAGEPSVREVPMFGGLSFMVDERMVVSARRDGDLLVRVDPGRYTELIDRHGARPAEMGSGRSMGTGWLAVPGERTATDEALRFWLDVGRHATGGPH